MTGQKLEKIRVLNELAKQLPQDLQRLDLEFSPKELEAIDCIVMGSDQV